jgi:hypothetical protein
VFFDTEVVLVLAPEADHADFERVAPGKVIDPSWSLERMIAKLVGLSASPRYAVRHALIRKPVGATKYDQLDTKPR